MPFSWSRWITPITQPKRFDTTFFLHILAQQSINSSNPLLRADGTETASAEWVSIISFREQGSMVLSQHILETQTSEYTIRSLEKVSDTKENYSISSTSLLIGRAGSNAVAERN